MAIETCPVKRKRATTIGSAGYKIKKPKLIVLCPDGLIDLDMGGACLKLIEHNAKSSPFLRLPGEIRNKIYQFVFDEPVVSIREKYKNRSDMIRIWAQEKRPRYSRASARGVGVRKHYFEIGATCRQIFLETRLMAYSRTHFGFQDEAMLTKWMDRLLPGQRDAVTHIRLAFSFSGSPLPRILDRLPSIKAIDIKYYGIPWWHSMFNAWPGLKDKWEEEWEVEIDALPEIEDTMLSVIWQELTCARRSELDITVNQFQVIASTQWLGSSEDEDGLEEEDDEEEFW